MVRAETREEHRMEIRGARADRLEGRHDPQLYVLIAGAAPDLEDFAFEEREKLFVAVNGDGVVRAIYDGSPSEYAYGPVTVTMRDGTQRVIVHAQHISPNRRQSPLPGTTRCGGGCRRTRR